MLIQSPTVPTRLVILGGSGFVGNAILRAAQHAKLPTLALHSRQLDLTGPDAAALLANMLLPTDTVVFAAAIDKGNRSTSEDTMRNLAMATQVAHAVRQVGIRHLIYLSSESVYGDADGLIRESTPAAPASLYGTMHRTRELILAAEAKVPLAVLRLSALYGLGDTHRAYGPNRFLDEAKQTGRITLFGHGEEYRDHLHIDDAAALILRTAMVQATGVLNLASGHAVTFAAIAEAMNVPVTSAPRRQPILHRHMDPTIRLALFPEVIPARIEQKIKELYHHFSVATI